MVSSTPRPLFTAGKDPVPIIQEVGWTSGPVWTGGKSRPNGLRSPDSQPVVSRYRLSYRAIILYYDQQMHNNCKICDIVCEMIVAFVGHS